jgi:hypothetical protein
LFYWRSHRQHTDLCNQWTPCTWMCVPHNNRSIDCQKFLWYKNNNLKLSVGIKSCSIPVILVGQSVWICCHFSCCAGGNYNVTTTATNYVLLEELSQYLRVILRFVSVIWLDKVNIILNAIANLWNHKVNISN